MSTMFPALAETEGKLKHRQDELGKIFAEAGETIDLSRVKSVEGDSKAIAAHITTLNAEMTDLAEEIKGLREVQRAAEATRNAEPGTEQAAEKGVVEAELMIASPQAVNPLTRQFITTARFGLTPEQLAAVQSVIDGLNGLDVPAPMTARALSWR